MTPHDLIPLLKAEIADKERQVMAAASIMRQLTNALNKHQADRAESYTAGMMRAAELVREEADMTRANQEGDPGPLIWLAERIEEQAALPKPKPEQVPT